MYKTFDFKLVFAGIKMCFGNGWFCILNEKSRLGTYTLYINIYVQIHTKIHKTNIYRDRVFFVKSNPPGTITYFSFSSPNRQSLVGSGIPRFLHSAVVVGNLMFVYGGNPHNGTTREMSEAKCFSADFLVYDIGKYCL